MRIIYILLVAFLIFSFGCKKNTENNVNIKPNEIQPLVNESKEISKEDIDKTVKIAEKILEKKIPEDVKKDLEEKVEKEAKKIKAEVINEIPSVKLDTDDIKIEWNDGKSKVMTCLAKGFSGNQKTNIITLSDFTGNLYENGKLSAKLQAKKAELNVEKKEIKVTTGVKINSLTNKSTLIANKVLWKSKENTIYAQEAQLNSPYGKITGKYFTLDTKLEIFQISDTGLAIK